MKFSKATMCGLLAIAYLAKHDGEAPFPGARIAKDCGLPLSSLLNALRQLARHGILASERSRNGGFRVDVPLDTLTVLEVVEALDGYVDVGVSGRPVQSAESEAVRARLASLWEAATDALRGALDVIRIVDLIDAKESGQAK